MTVELTRKAHYFGGRIEAPTDVVSADLGEKGQVYFLSPLDDHDGAKVPAVALTVEEADHAVVNGMREYDARTSMLADTGSKYPDAILRFESDQPVQFRHALMLAHTALSDKTWSEVAFLNLSDELAERCEDELELVQANVLGRTAGSRRLKNIPAYVGQAEAVFSQTAFALHDNDDIQQARFLPAREGFDE